MRGFWTSGASVVLDFHDRGVCRIDMERMYGSMGGPFSGHLETEDLLISGSFMGSEGPLGFTLILLRISFGGLAAAYVLVGLPFMEYSFFCGPRQEPPLMLGSLHYVRLLRFVANCRSSGCPENPSPMTSV